MCCSSVKNHLRGILIFHMVMLCISAIKWAISIIELFEKIIQDIRLIWITFGIFTIHVLLLGVYLLCIQGCITRNTCMLIPFIALKFIEIFGLAVVAIVMCIFLNTITQYHTLVFAITAIIVAGILFNVYFLAIAMMFYQDINSLYRHNVSLNQATYVLETVGNVPQVQQGNASTNSVTSLSSQ